MVRSKKGNGPEPSEFEESMGDVRPMKGRDKLRPTPAPRRPAPQSESQSPRFEVTQFGEKVEGHARGIDRKQLQRLKKGEFPVEERLDMHGLDTTTAQRALRQTCERAYEGSQRCVLVVHGRGLHSPDEAVLKEALHGWLTEPPLAQRVMAFASALDRDGGPGATYVLLRRARR